MQVWLGVVLRWMLGQQPSPIGLRFWVGRAARGGVVEGPNQEEMEVKRDRGISC